MVSPYISLILDRDSALNPVPVGSEVRMLGSKAMLCNKAGISQPHHSIRVGLILG